MQAATADSPPACTTGPTPGVKWVFGNDQDHDFGTADACTDAACLTYCEGHCPQGITSRRSPTGLSNHLITRGTARDGHPYDTQDIRPAPGNSFCVANTHGVSPDSAACASGSQTWTPPTCSETAAAVIAPESPASSTAPTRTPGSPTTLTNPLHTTSISELIARVIKAISGIAGAMALLMFVVGGVMWMTAEGSDRVGAAQTILKNASIGLVLIFLSYSLVSLFLGVLGL